MSRVSADRNSLREAAMKLPSRERARLASELIASLDGEEEEAVEAAWAAEIEKRAAEVESGTAKLVPWDTVDAEARDLIRRRR